MRSKGIAYATIAIIALLGVLAVSLWSWYQLSIGTTQQTTFSTVAAKDRAIQKVEATKQFLTQNLVFAANEASLEIGENGGTEASATYWYCNGEATPPTPEEVNYAISKATNNFLNSYIQTLKESPTMKGTSINEYECTGVYDPDLAACTAKDSTECEYFQVSGTQGGSITVTDPTFASYTGDISAPVYPNREKWIYYKLYENERNNGLLDAIANGYATQCQGQQLMADKLQVAIKNACDDYENLFDEYVKCTYEIGCLGCADGSCENTIDACLNFDCERSPLTEQLCWKSEQVSGDDSIDVGKKITFQGSSIAGIRVKYTLTDTKYKIPSSKGLKDLKWNVWAIISLAPQQCGPVD